MRKTLSRLRNKLYEVKCGVITPREFLRMVFRKIKTMFPFIARRRSTTELDKGIFIREKDTVSIFAGGGGAITFFTFADLKYHVFAAIYPVFALATNQDSCVEICLSEYELFRERYRNIMEFYNSNYPGRVLYRDIEVRGVFPNSVRFLVEPKIVSRYVYIGDIDILLLESDIREHHTAFMKKYNSDFSNILRNERQLTGLHFIEHKKMYPVKIPYGTDLYRTNDEVLLCSIMREKQLRFPPLGIPMSERKIHGLHVSLFNRPLLPTLTTKDRMANYPAWDLQPDPERYFEVRYSEPVTQFTKCINDTQIELRRIIQMADILCYYKLNEVLKY